ncbi:hypothetical protein BGZ94_007995, partial [Podila epigama]
PASLAHPRFHSIQQSLTIIAQQRTSTTILPSSSSSSSSSVSVSVSSVLSRASSKTLGRSNTTKNSRSKLSFTSTTSVFRKVTHQDLSLLNSQEIVRLAIYIMKHSDLDYADPLTCERVHTAGEDYYTKRNNNNNNNAEHKQQPTTTMSAAAEIYFSETFHIGQSVLHNPEYPLKRPLESTIAIATFCAKASGGLRTKSSYAQPAPQRTTPNSIASSRAGAKWLARLGQIIFGGPCSHAGHPHHRRTRASLDLLEHQNIELGKHILVEEQRRRQEIVTSRRHTLHFATSSNKRSSPPSNNESFGVVSPFTPHSGSQSPIAADFYPLSQSELLAARDSTPTTSDSTSTLSTTGTSRRSAIDKWCKHCSRAVACLVLVAAQEARIRAAKQQQQDDQQQQQQQQLGDDGDEYVLDDSGFDADVSGFEPLDTPLSSSASSPQTLSPSSPSFSLSPGSGNDFGSDDNNNNNNNRRSTMHFDTRPRLKSKSDIDNDGRVESPYIFFDHSHEIRNPSLDTKAKINRQSSLKDSVADALDAKTTITGPTHHAHLEVGHGQGTTAKNHKSNNNSNNNNSGSHTSSSLGSDVELVSRVTSPHPLSLQNASSRPSIPTGARMMSSPPFSPSSPLSSPCSMTLLERDLAEAIATTAPNILPPSSSTTSSPSSSSFLPPYHHHHHHLANTINTNHHSNVNENDHEICNNNNNIFGRRLSASDIGLQPKPNLDSIRESISRSNSSSSSLSSSSSSSSLSSSPSSVSDPPSQDEALSSSPSSSSSSPLVRDRQDPTRVKDDSKNDSGNDSDNQVGDGSLTVKHELEQLEKSPPTAFDNNVNAPDDRTQSQDNDQDNDQDQEQDQERHHPFYALGIHSQTPVDEYAIEISESIQRAASQNESGSDSETADNNEAASPKLSLDNGDNTLHQEEQQQLQQQQDIMEESVQNLYERGYTSDNNDSSNDDDDNDDRESGQDSDKESENEEDNDDDDDVSSLISESSSNQDMHNQEKGNHILRQVDSENDDDEDNKINDENESEDNKDKDKGKDEDSEMDNEKDSEKDDDSDYIETKDAETIENKDSPVSTKSFPSSTNHALSEAFSTSTSTSSLTEDSYLDPNGSSGHSSDLDFDLDDDVNNDDGGARDHSIAGQEGTLESNYGSPSSVTPLLSPSSSSSSSSPPSSSTSSLTLKQKQQQLLQRRRRQQLVDDAKRKQEQLDRIRAQLELKALGKIRQQVSFWEEKGVLEQKVVSVEEVEIPDPEDKDRTVHSTNTSSSAST